MGKKEKIGNLLQKCLEQENVIEQLQTELQEFRNQEHGLYAYGGGCRCEICKKAKSESSKKYLQNLKAKRALEMVK